MIDSAYRHADAIACARRMLENAQRMYYTAHIDPREHIHDIACREYADARRLHRVETSAAVRRYLRYQAICAIATLRILKTENPL